MERQFVCKKVNIFTLREYLYCLSCVLKKIFLSFKRNHLDVTQTCIINKTSGALWIILKRPREETKDLYSDLCLLHDMSTSSLMTCLLRHTGNISVVCPFV